MDDILNKLLPFLSSYPLWVRVLFATWLVVTAVMAGSFIIARPESDPTEDDPVDSKPTEADNSASKPTATGDQIIDDVLADLQKRFEADARPTDAELVTALNPLFSRAAFLDMREEDWNYFIYVLARTRIILARHVSDFRDPAIRKNLGAVIEKMIELQNEVAAIYGPAFSITDHLEKHKDDKVEFMNSLPNVASTPDSEFFEARNQTIRDIRSILKPLGLTSW